MTTSATSYFLTLNGLTFAPVKSGLHLRVHLTEVGSAHQKLCLDKSQGSHWRCGSNNNIHLHLLDAWLPDLTPATWVCEAVVGSQTDC